MRFDHAQAAALLPNAVSVLFSRRSTKMSLSEICLKLNVFLPYFTLVFSIGWYFRWWLSL